MICSKCGKEFSDEMKNCPFCLEPVTKEKKKFVVNVAEEEAEKDEAVFSSDRRQAYRQSFLAHENNTYDDGGIRFSDAKADTVSLDFSVGDEKTDAQPATDAAQSASEEDIGEIRFASEDTTACQPDGQTGPELSQSAEELATPIPQPDTAAAPTREKTERKPEKQPNTNAAKSAKAFLTLKIMIAVCVLLTVSLTVVGASTSVFKNSAGADKTVALSGLSKEAAASFEKTAPVFYGFFESGYDSRTMTLDSLVPYLSPDSETGILAAMFTRQPITENQPDPLGRFADGENIAYVSVDSQYVHEAAQLFGLSYVDDIDTADCYYYSGRYYFSVSQNSAEADKKQIKVTSSKMTQEGRYYIECALYPETAERDEKGNFSGEPESNVYVIAECEKTDRGFDWTVSRISPTPLFDAAGSAVADGESDGLPYEMKRKTVKAVTQDGQAYANYIIEYPYFTTEGITQSTVNTLYRQLISSYEKKAAQADTLYNRYVKSGASVGALPLTVHIVSTVTFNEKGYLSLLERTTENDPTVTGQTVQQETTAVSSSQEPGESGALPSETPVMPETTYEGYTFDVESGDFVQKDDVLGKDYQAVQRLLFDVYSEKNTSGEPAQEPTSSPYGYGQSQGEKADTKGIGQAIYACPWVLMPDGVGFCYQPENGGAQTVVLGYDKLDTDIFSGR